MKFVDEVTIEVEAGNGGDGCLSFHRGRNLPKGGPDGGDGGNGGDVNLVGHESLNTLVDLRFKPHLKAINGQRGGSSNKQGARGDDLVIQVPVGTTVIDDETLEIIGDITKPEQSLKVGVGGERGRGNAHYKSSTNRSPRRISKGTPGETRRLRLQLKVIADVGLLGLPNAGKSTLIGQVSAAHPKIADYPFTTITPSLGVVAVGDSSFVMADIPGLIRGASEGLGLGTQFLRHLSRTRLLLHLVDVLPVDGSDPIENVFLIEEELRKYSKGLAQRPIWIVLTKIDLTDPSELLGKLKNKYPKRPIHAISSITNSGIDNLKRDLMSYINAQRELLKIDGAAITTDEELRDRISSEVLQNGLMKGRSPEPDNLIGTENEHNPDLQTTYKK